MPIPRQVIVGLLHNQFPEASVTQEAVDLLNAIVDRIMEVLFPKNSSVVLESVKARLRAMDNNFAADILEHMSNMEDDHVISLETVKKMIRMHAGDVSVPMDTLKHIEWALHVELESTVSNLINFELTEDKNKVQAKDIINYFYNNEDGRRSGLNASPFGPLEKAVKRGKKSKSKKSKSKRRCSVGNLAVKSFVRDGKRIKSYCRKK